MGERVNLQSRRELLKQFAPQYCEASSAQKRVLLDTFVQATGYHCRYGMWLLNHAEDVLHIPAYARPSQYGREVQHALFLAWHAANRICAKRLIPFLPSILDSLERHRHIQLSEQSRGQLLSMSAATADRLLRAHRRTTARSLSTTKVGPLLKQQIPIRTFAQWDEAQPGFLEADLVAHCGGHLEGGCLYTLTLTDVATGWTECLPLLNRGREVVLTALQRARMLFPFPILGIDTDNGGEFINEEVASYCAHEQITFTRGRPYEKRDQCFVEQKNGVVVRQVVGHGRLIGDHACQQLAELYRALRLYVNCFQPSMKLVAKQVEGRTVRRVYDAARTPLQRLLLSGVLPASSQQELRAAAIALDPIRLLHHVQQLQQAVFRCEVSVSSDSQWTSGTSLLKFELEDGTTKSLLSEEMGHDEGAVSQNGCQELQENTHVLNRRRTSKDPFADQWEHILSWVQANPTRSSGDIFRQLQSLFPGRYQPLHIRSLQRGMRRIRAHVLEMRKAPRQKEVIHGDLPSPVELHQAKPAPEGRMHLSARFAPARSVDPSAGETSTSFSLHHHVEEDQSMHSPVRECEASAKSEPHTPSPGRGICLTIEGAIQSYLQTHHKARHSPKTLAWHQMALHHLQHYLLVECHLLLVSQIRETDIRGWVASLAQTPTATGKRRSASTIETYARSARAFCTWLVQRRELLCSPMSESSFPRTSVPLPQLLATETVEQFLQAGSLAEAKVSKAKRMAARDRAILWVFIETGMSVCEVCSLRLGDVDRKTGILSVRGKGDKVRQLTLGPRCLEHLLSYLKQAHSEKKDRGAERSSSDEPLFLSEQGRSLTNNTVTLLFVRLSKRTGSSGIAITPKLLLVIVLNLRTKILG
jgi:site-specific recombinase XerD